MDPLPHITDDIDAIKQLIASGTDINKQYWPGRISLLHNASSWGRIEIVKYLVESGANLDLVNMNNETALHCAANNNRVDVIKYLLDAGIDKNIVSDTGKTAVMIALKYGYVEIAEYIESFEWIPTKGVMDEYVGSYNDIPVKGVYLE